MDKVKDILGKIKGGWETIDKKKRVTLVTALVGVILVAGIITWYTHRVTYAALFTNLEIQDSANITADLDARGDIKYKLENSGKDIYIDQAYVDKYRLELATKGLMPESSTGFEIFDNQNLMLTDEDRQIMYQRAMEGELQRSVMSLSEIKSARVHLVMSKDSIFNSEKTQASASVIVDIKPGSKLTKDQVKGIVALLTGAVENLPEANVKVIDSSGNLLNLGMANDSSTGVSSYDKQNEIKGGFEAELESNILSLLGPAYGADKIKITVYADLDFDATEQTVITYKDPVVRSEQKSATGSSVNSGTVDSSSNTDNTQNVLNGSGSTGQQTYDGTTNYELSQSTTKTVKAPGQVRKITTSVIYDGNLTAAQKATIQNLVATATGYDANRGDLINIEGVIFDKSYQDDTSGSGTTADSDTFFGKYKIFFIIGGAVLLLALVAAAVVGFLSRKKKGASGSKAASETPVTVGQQVDILDELYRKKTEKAFEVKENRKEKQVKEYVQEHPEIAADLIKAWLKD